MSYKRTQPGQAVAVKAVAGMLAAAERIVSVSFSVPPPHDERMFAEVITKKVVKIGQSGNWRLLAAIISVLITSGTCVTRDEQARRLGRYFSIYRRRRVHFS